MPVLNFLTVGQFPDRLSNLAFLVQGHHVWALAAEFLLLDTGSETHPISVKERGLRWFKDHMTTPPHHNFRRREAQQAENEDRSSNEKESKMIAGRLELQTFSSKQSQAQSACQPRKAMPSS
eukprot:1152970-Pelagomonas_calceolata.AAC.2